MKNFISLLVLLFSFGSLMANTILIKKEFNWKTSPSIYEMGEITYQRYAFDEAIYDEKYPSLSFAVEKFDVDGYGDLQVEILRAQYEDFNKITSPDDVYLEEQIKLY